jgi:hypothetical protein
MYPWYSIFNPSTSYLVSCPGAMPAHSTVDYDTISMMGRDN